MSKLIRIWVTILVSIFYGIYIFLNFRLFNILKCLCEFMSQFIVQCFVNFFIQNFGPIDLFLKVWKVIIFEHNRFEHPILLLTCLFYISMDSMVIKSFEYNLLTHITHICCTSIFQSLNVAIFFQYLAVLFFI